MIGATEFSYAQGGGTVNYGILNGRYMTVYTDQYGDLGLRTFAAGIPVNRPAGAANSVTGYPTDSNIDTTGQLIPSANPLAYTILRSLDDRSAEGSLQIAIMGRRELLTVGEGTVCGAWGVYSDHADLSTGVMGIDGLPSAYSVSGADAESILSSTSVVMLLDSGAADLLEVTTVYSFQNDATDIEQIRIKVEVTLRNAHATDVIENLLYGFFIDPNMNITSGDTLNYFMSAVDTDAFAVEATSTGDWTVAIAVYETEGEGYILGYNTETREQTLCRAVDTFFDADANIRLGSGTNADYYALTVLTDSTTNFKTDAAWRAGLPSVNGTYSIFMRSPEADLDPAEEVTFTFYIITGPAVSAAAAPTTRAWAYVS